MKHSLTVARRRFAMALLAGFLFAAPEVTAQMSPWPLASPEVHSDASVTFRLKAEKAEKVLLVSDCFAGQGTYFVEMEPDTSGLWSYTTEPLPSELYTYSFVVDGVRTLDPSNAFAARNVTELSNLFLVPGGQADLYNVQNVPHGSLTKAWYSSPTLEKTRRLTVYTPPGYEESTDSYPVLYLLHGHGGDENAWEELGCAAQIMDNLIARNEAVPMIVVMPNGNAVQEAAPVNASLAWGQPDFRTDLRQEMDGSFERSFPDILRYVESHYRVQADRAHRAVAGLSMGGFHTQHITMAFPDLFDYVGLFSGLVGLFPYLPSYDYEEQEQQLAALFAKAPRLYWIAIGSNDFLYKANEDYRAFLDTKGYTYTYSESKGGHTWDNWRAYLSEFATKIFRP